MKRLLAAAALAASPAEADILFPDDYVPEESARFFQVCRAAALYHLDAAEAPGAVVTHPVARTLLEQINFVMWFTLTREMPSTLGDGARMLAFTEKWVIGFGQVVRDETGLTDPATRETVLMRCVPVIWMIMREDIEMLLAWREKAVDAPAIPSAEEIYARQLETLRRLTGED